MTFESLREAYENLNRDATRLAGGLTDLSQRATVYHHIYRESGGNHIFPLIAAHGALWARGWFNFGLKLSGLLSIQYGFARNRRQEQLAKLDDFANAFRDINRRVCIDVYCNFHFTRCHGDHPDADQLVPPEILRALNKLHAAHRDGRSMTDRERRTIFESHFLSEQEQIVGPTIEKAITEFDWPLVRAIALRPLVRFAYFPKAFWFRNFADREERIRKGLRAFDIAADAGWGQVEDALREYDALPESFFAKPVEHFASLRASVLTPAGSF